MPSQEPNSKMDELLRAYAKKRGEQAEPLAELHPATRKLLQDEVKRTFSAAPAPTSTPTRQTWRAWRWPLLAMWGGMAVLLVMFAMLNAQLRSLAPVTEKEELRIKKDEKIPADAARLSASAGQDARARQDILSATVPPAAPAAVAESRASPIPMAAPPPLESGELIGRPAYRAARAPQRMESAVPAAASASAPLAASDALDVAAGNFVQVHDRARAGQAPPPPSNLLSNFRMLRSGQNVSVVDADGSVYNGLVLNGISNRAGFGGALQQAKAFQNAVVEETNWTFNVTGVNNSLKQNIIFTGNVLDMPWASTFNNVPAQNRNASQFQNGSNASQAPSTQNSRITGKVQVGGGKLYEIEAKPPAP
jgi:hypothetical protein